MAKSGKNVRDPQAVTPASLTVRNQKGSPQSRPATASRKGVVSKSADTRNLTVSGAKRPPAAPATRPRSRQSTGQEPFQSTRDALAGRSTSPNRIEVRRPAVRPQARPTRSVSYSTWKDMSRAERRAAGLPVSDMPEAAFNQAMSRR